MSYPQSNRKADRFRSAPRQGKIKPVVASRDVPGEKSSAFGRGNVVAKIVRFPPADLEKADRFRSAPRKAKNQAGCGSEGSAKENSIALFVQISVESGTLEPTIADSKSGQV